MMDALCMIVTGSILVEAIVSAVKPIWDEEKLQISFSRLASVFFGVLFSLAAGLDIAGVLGVEIKWPVVSQVATGIIISRGSNYVYDLIEQIKRRKAV